MDLSFALAITRMDSITEEEKKVINELKKRTINDVTPKLLEDASVFYRFAKARDFNLEEAEAMLRRHLSWRKEFQFDTILTDYEPPEVLKKYGASSLVCFDKEGSAVRLQDWGHLDVKGMCNAATKTEVAKFWVFLAERDRAELIKRGGNLEKPIFSPVYDLEDMTYSKAVNMRGLQYLLYGVKMLIDNFPECVKTITIINAPFYFAWIYAALKRILPTTVTQKMRIFGTDWKEALLNDVNADDLPAYLGGNKTDPDGNPHCETIIQHGKPIPKSYYRQSGKRRLALASDAEKLTVLPFNKEEITFEVKEENSYIEWEFEIKKGDIEFSLKYKADLSENSETVELIPKQRIDTSFEYEKGCFKCDKTGYYTMVFDNYYSWLHSKEIYYRASIRIPKNDEVYEST
ncbi:retinal-binding protein-like isoform X3 [Argiope bruennichi]|uniref:retinal-binding protein-like isoform X3 n=1 Tax=Argiope bruennichi TaxID=94029 RepID=UPI0024946656|nr:retinal-binding protein-like isoform X3 [Argiope bruennichi]